MVKNLKIGQKFALSLMIVSLVPLAIISFSNYYYSKSELKSKTIGSLRAINNSRATHINHLIQLRQEQAKELAGTYVSRQLRAEGFNHPEAIQIVQEHIESVYRELKISPRSDYKNIDQESAIENISIWDIHGNIVANTNRELIGKKMPFKFLHILYEKGAYFRGFEKDPLTGENFLTILEGIRNWETGKYAGVILLKTSAKILNYITTDREGLGETAENYIVDKERRMITESRFIKDSVLNVRVNTEGTDACFSDRVAPAIYKDYQGRMVLGAQRYLPDQEWCLLTEIDANEAFAPITDFRNRMLIVVGGSVLFVLVFVNLTGRAFIRPILELRDASLEVARKNYDIEITTQSKDEIGELSRAFNQMTKILYSTTSELEKKNKMLEEQKVLLEKVNLELDGFVYTASHDLRAPLRGIASFAKFLEEDYKDKLDEEGKDYINEIQSGTQRLNKLIEDLLALSRISRIKNPYERVNFKELIVSIIKRIEFDIKEYNVDLRIQEKMPVVACDRIKIGEVFLNLINNAIKFSSKNKKVNPKVEVGYSDEGNFYKFYIKDNGIGIDPKYHQQIFGIFKRLHTTKEYDGSGAGLSIVKRVIDDHKGKIWIESALGKGAKFCFTIPKDLKVEKESDDPVSEGDSA